MLCCHRNTGSLVLKRVPYPEFELGDDTSFCNEKEVALSVPDGFDVYEWSNGSSGSSITINTPGTYVLTITNYPDCKTTDTINIEVRLCDPIVPNVLTGNDDGHNDTFTI